MTNPANPPAEDAREKTVREHVTTLHLIGEQLSQVENWMWQHLADVRDDSLPPANPAAVRAAALREAIAVLDQRATAVDALSSSDFGEEARAVRELADAANELRRLADETQPAQPEPEEAHEPLHRWRVEILDGDEWMPCSRTFGARSLAVDRYRSSSERTPAWADGEPVQRRLVRETTTYTVEAEHASALEPRQDGAGS